MVTAILGFGAVGVNIEDQVIGENKLFTLQQQSKQLLAAREAADKMSNPMFLNSRTGVFFQAKPDEHDENLIQQVLERAHLYQENGANGLFVPGLIDLKLIEILCKGHRLAC